LFVKLRRLVAITLLASASAALLPTSADAQRRAVPRVVPPPRTVIVGGGYAPFYWDPWYRYGGGWYGAGWYGAGWGGWGSWGPGWGGPGWAGGPPLYYGQRFYNAASLRLQVTPSSGEVFIDGYYAGTVDQFDGTFQRLRVEPGEHEVVVYADGFRTLRQRLYLQPLGTVNLKQTLEPLQPGDVQDARPSPSTRTADTARAIPQGQDRQSQRPRARAVPQQNPVPPQGAVPAPVPPVGNQRPDATVGVLAVRVQPGGAAVLIDGERWEGPSGEERLLVQLTPGEHRIEVRRQGYQSFSRTITIRGGETETVNVSLSRQ
jgi:hypothetical protein